MPLSVAGGAGDPNAGSAGGGRGGADGAGVMSYVSVGLEKSAVMQVARKVPHPRYLKLINKTKKFTFHDEDNSCQVGMVVQIEACRPMSKSKKFTLKKICSDAGCAAE